MRIENKLSCGLRVVSLDANLFSVSLVYKSANTMIFDYFEIRARMINMEFLKLINSRIDFKALVI
jgi:hypothetical protein